MACQLGANPDSKIHGANMGPTWVLSAPDRPHVGAMNLAIREAITWKMLTYLPAENSLTNLSDIWIKIQSLLLFLFENAMCRMVAYLHIDGLACLVQDCSNSIANALELLQSCTILGAISI